MEIIGQAAGFTPRDVSKGWEGFIAKRQAVIYYQTWRTDLMLNWNYAKDKRDKEGEKKANIAIRRYNRIVPFPEMKIGPETRERSYETYRRTQKLNELGVEQNTFFQRLSSSIEAVFAEADSEDN
jgi:hypothetical protein